MKSVAEHDSSTRPAIRRLTPCLGAEVLGVDLREELDDETVELLREAVLRYKVLILRGQDFSTDQHVRFAARFGEPDIHPSTPKDQKYPAVLYLHNGPNSAARADMWHTDGSWRAEPSWLTVLRSRTIPPVGGDTFFVDMGAAFEGLSPAMKLWLPQLTAAHDMVSGFAKRSDVQASRPTDKQLQDHPVVAVHPDTGERILYVNKAFTAHVHGLSQEESDWLLNHLFKEALAPEYQLRIQWEPDMVVMWDNWSVQHYATYDYFPEIREMERVAIASESSFSAAQRR